MSDTPQQRPTPRRDERPMEQPRQAAAAEPAPRQPAFEPANDSGRRTPASMLRTLDNGSIRSAIRNATIVSVLWIIAGLGLGQLVYGSQLWQITSVSGVLSAPGVWRLPPASSCRS